MTDHKDLCSPTTETWADVITTLLDTIKSLVDEHRLFPRGTAWVCPFCGVDSLVVVNFPHKNDCPVVNAHKILNQMGVSFVPLGMVEGEIPLTKIDIEHEITKIDTECEKNRST